MGRPGSEQIPAPLLDPDPEKPRELVHYFSKLLNPHEKAYSRTLALFKIKGAVDLFPGKAALRAQNPGWTLAGCNAKLVVPGGKRSL